MTTTLNGLDFDPGFGPYILAFRGAVEYLYLDINKFKNLSQKKVKFMQYHKKILEIFDNNLGFYVGCLMWAAYIKTQPKQKILSNHCFGQEYNEKDNISETNFMKEFIKHYPRDIKYYMGKSFEFDENISKLIQAYEDFLVLNKGFVESEFNTDILIPESIKISEPENCKKLIDEILETEDLSKFLKYLPEIV